MLFKNSVENDWAACRIEIDFQYLELPCKRIAATAVAGNIKPRNRCRLKRETRCVLKQSGRQLCVERRCEIQAQRSGKTGSEYRYSIIEIAVDENRTVCRRKESFLPLADKNARF